MPAGKVVRFETQVDLQNNSGKDTVRAQITGIWVGLDLAST